VQVGTGTAITDAKGRFVARAETGDDVIIRQHSLASGSLVTPRHTASATAYVEIPVVRTGELRVQVLLDARAGSPGPGAGLTVQLEDRDGRAREAITDTTGVARFGALLPGPATLRVLTPAARPGESGSVQEQTVTVEAGTVTRAVVEIAHRPREIRFLQNSN
jgi:hypothetical protein